MKSSVFLLFILVILAGCSSRDYEKIYLVSAGDNDMINTPVFADMENIEFNSNTTLCLHSRHETVPGQIENFSGSGQRIWWIVNLEAGQSAEYGLIVNEGCTSGIFEWSRVGEYSNRLLFDGQGVIQYEHPVFDTANFYDTQKPFHHIFEPAGYKFITKGDPDGLYPHHRGIFYGYNRIYFNDKEVNVWAARNGYSEHAEVIDQFAGPVMGGHKVKIYWKDDDGEPFIEETREVRIFRQAEGESLIDFHSTLRTLVGSVRLDGDRQHAGVQFRAAEHVAENRDETKFIRPASWSHLGPTDEIAGDDIYDLPWNAMFFPNEGKEGFITLVYMSHPDNPDNAEMSERLYGRFGEFFPYDLTENNPLIVNYRFLVKEGEEPSVETIDLRFNAYSSPAVVTQNK